MSYWDGKRICVTGGAGFLGGHLLEMLTFRVLPWIIRNPSR